MRCFSICHLLSFWDIYCSLFPVFLQICPMPCSSISKCSKTLENQFHALWFFPLRLTSCFLTSSFSTLDSLYFVTLLGWALCCLDPESLCYHIPCISFATFLRLFGNLHNWVVAGLASFILGSVCSKVLKIIFHKNFEACWKIWYNYDSFNFFPLWVLLDFSLNPSEVLFLCDDLIKFILPGASWDFSVWKLMSLNSGKFNLQQRFC